MRANPDVRRRLLMTVAMFPLGCIPAAAQQQPSVTFVPNIAAGARVDFSSARALPLPSIQDGPEASNPKRLPATEFDAVTGAVGTGAKASVVIVPKM